MYAIVNSRSIPASWRMPGGERLHVVRSRTCAAVVSDAPRRPPSPANLRRHDRTVRALAERFPAVIPVRFGTVMTGDELIFTLSSRGAALGEALARVRNRVQMTIRVVNPRGAPERPVRASAAATTGRQYLIARAREAAAAAAVPGFEPVLAAVARWVRDERVERRAGVTTVYHLIPRSSVAAYRGALQTSASAAGVRPIVSGPWPAYAFASPD